VRVIKRAVIVVGVAWLAVLGYAFWQVWRDDWAQDPTPWHGDVRWN
jgi:hypothetical protein